MMSLALRSFRQTKAFLVATAAILCAGCFISRRHYAVIDVNELDKSTRTVNRYQIVSMPSRFRGASKAFGFEIASINKAAWQMYPGVFAADGMPVVITDEAINLDRNNTHTLIWGPLQLLPIPGRSSEEYSYKCKVSLQVESTARSEFLFDTKFDSSFSLWLPTSYLFFNASLRQPGKPCYEAHEHYFWSPNGRKESDEKWTSAIEGLRICGIAAMLKKMEDAGIVTDDVVKKWSEYMKALAEAKQRAAAETAEKRRQEALAKQRREQERQALLAAQRQAQSVQQPQVVQVVQQVVQQKPQQPKFTITSFVPVDADNDFSYSFEVTMNDDASPSEFSSMYGAFINDMKKIYQSMNPNVDMNSLVVDAKPSLQNRKFVGVARMLTLRPEKLEYDAVTRRGKISLRFGTGQYESARAWARRNIETLARDKNIALTTGEIPPAAKFYLGNEELKAGNVLEIEFRTE